MKHIISMVLIMCPFSLDGMAQSQGKRSATEALPQTGQKKPAVKYPMSPLELLPGELQYEIVKALTKAGGETPRARLDNAARSIRSFFRTNRLFRSFQNDPNLIDYLITELANNYAEGDKIAAAIALGTESARKWLDYYLKGPAVTREIAQPRINLFYKKFMEAVRNSRLNVLDFLLSISIYDDAWESFVIQGLLEATETGNVNVINTILSHDKIKPIKGLLMNKTIKVEETLLFSAVRANSPQIVAIFIAAGADVNHPNYFQWTPLHYAAEGPYVDIVKKLLDARANVNASNENGETPLMLAAMNDSIDVVNLLIDAGADVNQEDIQEHNALSHARFYAVKNKDAIIKALTEHGAI